MYSFQWIFFSIVIFKQLLQITLILQNPQLYVFGYIWMFYMVNVFCFFKKSKFGDATLCVALSYLLGHLMLWQKYNQSTM
jgi:hypothetical protein